MVSYIPFLLYIYWWFFYSPRLPNPRECDLYYVNRDTLFSYHKESEMFLQVFFPSVTFHIYFHRLFLVLASHSIVNHLLRKVLRDYYIVKWTYACYSNLNIQRMMALYVASHYKNSPNDLQLMADAPAHQLFVLLGMEYYVIYHLWKSWAPLPIIIWF